MYWRVNEIGLDTGLREGVLIEDPHEERRGSITMEDISLPKKILGALF